MFNWAFARTKKIRMLQTQQARHTKLSTLEDYVCRIKWNQFVLVENELQVNLTIDYFSTHICSPNVGFNFLCSWLLAVKTRGDVIAVEVNGVYQEVLLRSLTGGGSINLSIESTRTRLRGDNTQLRLCILTQNAMRKMSFNTIIQ